MTAAASRIISVVVTALLAFSVALVGVGTAESGFNVEGVSVDDPFFVPVLAIYVLTTGAVAWFGAVLSTKVVGNPIGKILTGLGLWLAVSLFAGAALTRLASSGANSEHLRNLGAWLGAWTFIPIITIPAAVILVLFPNGRPLSPRWQVFIWLAAIGTASWAVAEASRPVLGVTDLLNPYVNRQWESAGDTLSIVLVGCLAGALANIILRFRRSRGDERLQIKWITFAGILLVVTWGLLWLVSEVAPDQFGGREIAGATLTITLLFVAIGAAVLKYRLYEIDRLISRTVSYTLVAGLLALVYAAVAVGIPQVLGFAEQSSLTTAAGTLVAAALFRPITTRLHNIVDRRFNRVRFDAQNEVEGLSSNLGQRLDLAGVVETMSNVVQRTVAPSALGVWIRTRP